jgi:hypothetical protein
LTGTSGAPPGAFWLFSQKATPSDCTMERATVP